MDHRATSAKGVFILVLSLLYACSDNGDDSPERVYSVGGSASGLAGIVTLNNSSGGQRIDVEGDSFSFAAQGDLSEYSVSIEAQPEGQICALENASGTVLGADVSNIALTCSSRWQGSQQFGTEGWDTAKAMVVANDGSSYFLGRSYSASLDDNFYALCKREATGEAAWLWLDEQELSGFHDAAVDDAGNVYVVANYSTGDGIRNFLVKLNAQGELQWAERLGGDYLLTIQGLLLGSDGNLYAAGYTYSDVVDGQNRKGIVDLAVLQISTSGQLNWIKLLGEENIQSMLADRSGITETPDGDILVSYARYSFESGYDYERRLVLARFRPDGSVPAAWPVSIPVSAYSSYLALSEPQELREPVLSFVDASGDIYLSGFAWRAFFNADAGGTFVIKLSGTDGSPLWAQPVGEPFSIMDNMVLLPLALQVDDAGNAIIAGAEPGTQSGLEPVLLKLDGEGQLIWKRGYDLNGQDYVAGIGFDPLGRLLVGGVTYGELEGTVSLGKSDYFLTKLDAMNGEVLGEE